MAVEAQGCFALLSALGPEVETLKMRDLRMVTSEAIKLVAPIWRMNAFTVNGHVSAEFMFAITHNCPLLETLVVEPWVITINHRPSVVQLDMARFIQSLNPVTLRNFYWGGGIPLTQAAASVFDTILDILPGLQELGVPLKFFSLVLAQTLSNSKLQRLTLIPSSRALGGIDAPALVARSEEIVRALGVAMVEFSSSGVEWEARDGVDSFIGYEGVKRMLALAKARLDAGVRYEDPSAAKA
ncbi:BZ3500_MvSof-1268-A1-R1_Chr7-3g09631 [Microbotryum saponariae]|uniref:BZ3500_MvSof-1268-A1-R1_Chr7-3g09631 protein n=1 Tax=Microbotryum saponariae TaxID=289078 RepID=A0A2X0N589_9BASI|nr:BZ3500_MvSof-1268-A1-R1_Chr7-3g09631 [Microbotryum saponariae]